MDVAPAVKFSGGVQTERFGDERIGLHLEIGLRAALVADSVFVEDRAQGHTFAEHQRARLFRKMLEMNRDRAELHRLVILAGLQHHLALVAGLGFLTA